MCVCLNGVADWLPFLLDYLGSILLPAPVFQLKRLLLTVQLVLKTEKMKVVKYLNLFHILCHYVSHSIQLKMEILFSFPFGVNVYRNIFHCLLCQ